MTKVLLLITVAENNQIERSISGSGCIELQDKIDSYTEKRLPVYIDKEEEIKEILNEMPSALEIEKMLDQVGLDIKEFYAFYGNEKIKNAVLYAKDLKDRYTVLWLNYDLFGDM